MTPVRSLQNTEHSSGLVPLEIQRKLAHVDTVPSAMSIIYHRVN